ncbi:MAG: hypothetical protein RLN69_13285 [Woeseiaceae bacterium]
MSDNYPKSADGVIVRLDRNVDKRAVAALLTRAGQGPGTFRVDWSNGSGMYYLKPKQRLALPRAWQLARNLTEADSVLYAEVDVAVPGLDAPGADRQGRKQFFRGDEVPLPGSDDPEWSLECARVKQAWALKPKGRRYGQGIRIGHPDTGYRRHPEIDEPSRLLSQMGFDFEDGQSDPVDPLKKPHFGHGTSTASVIISAIGSPDGSPE